MYTPIFAGLTLTVVFLVVAYVVRVTMDKLIKLKVYKAYNK